MRPPIKMNPRVRQSEAICTFCGLCGTLLSFRENYRSPPTIPPAFDLLGVPDTDIRYSRDPADHVGFLRFTLRRWRLRGHLLDFEPDELLAIAYIETADLLAKKYDPTRATVTSFLSSYLFGRVQYAALRGKGMRRQHNEWRKPADLDEPPRRHQPSPSEASELEELVANLAAAGYPTGLRFHEGPTT
jgi:hypothetical protein